MGGLNTSVSRATRRLSEFADYNVDPTYDELQCHVEKVSDFLLIRRINCRLQEAMCGYVESQGVTCLSIFLEASGEIEFDKDNSLSIAPKTAVITQADYCSFNLPMGTRLNTVELLFDSRVLQQQGFELGKARSDSFSNRIKKGDSVSVSKSLSQRSTSIVDSMLACKTGDITGKLFLQAKALELLSDNILQESEPPTRSTFSHSDKRKIHKAQELIDQQYYKALTIKALSRAAGINEKKLKDGFRVLLGTTVHSYIESVRLSKARQFLGSGKKITETALEVGYSSPSHFAKRFQKSFGVTPKHWQMTAFRSNSFSIM